MESVTRRRWEELRSPDGATRLEALNALLAATDEPVDWAYEVWDELVAALRDPDNHRRAIAAQLLCNLAKSDPEGRALRDLDALFALTRDAKFVTARHSLQALWKVGAVSAEHRQAVAARLAERYRDCAAEKNSTLIRYDIIAGLRSLYGATRDERLRETAMALIAAEADPKYRQKYASLWREPRRGAAGRSAT